MLLGLNHSITRTHDLRGPFKYGRYGTETASTVVIGDAESVGTQVYRFLLSYTLFVTTSSFISSRQGKSQPSHTPFHECIVRSALLKAGALILGPTAFEALK